MIVIEVFGLIPFLTNAQNLLPLKSPENPWFSGVSRGYKMEHWPETSGQNE